MQAIVPTIFGRGFNDTPQPMSLQGQTGWFSVPRGWYCRPQPDASNQLYVSPNADFSAPVYLAVMSDDLQTMVFQDIYAEAAMGMLNPAANSR
jgi:hypothetical protein